MFNNHILYHICLRYVYQEIDIIGHNFKVKSLMTSSSSRPTNQNARIINLMDDVICEWLFVLEKRVLSSAEEVILKKRKR